jgi:hypothetical protein
MALHLMMSSLKIKVLEIQGETLLVIKRLLDFYVSQYSNLNVFF